jgi:hypothetical protein
VIGPLLIWVSAPLWLRTIQPKRKEFVRRIAARASASFCSHGRGGPVGGDRNNTESPRLKTTPISAAGKTTLARVATKTGPGSCFVASAGATPWMADSDEPPLIRLKPKVPSIALDATAEVRSLYNL